MLHPSFEFLAALHPEDRLPRLRSGRRHLEAVKQSEPQQFVHFPIAHVSWGYDLVISVSKDAIASRTCDLDAREGIVINDL